MLLHGLVAIVSDDGSTVDEIRDLGPEGATVKPGNVLPLVDVRPEVTETQALGEASFTIEADRVVRTWAVVHKPTDAEIDADQIGRELGRAGSVLRAIAEVQFAIMKGQIAIDPKTTRAQYLSMLRQRMRA